MKRGQSGIHALVAIEKPQGPTSHDVVSRVRRIVQEKRVGHMGTLDPLASGLLIVGIGQATRLTDSLQNHDKSYRASIKFGESTTTDDAEGQVVDKAAIPEILTSPDALSSYLKTWIGKLQQVPPSFSAIKVNGQPVYKSARRGQIADLAPRPIEIKSIDLIEVFDSTIVVDMCVSKGTYIRSFARDLGKALLSAAHLVGLKRTMSGNVHLSDAYSLEELESAASKNQLSSTFLDPAKALDWPLLEISDEELAAVISGNYLIPKNGISQVTDESRSILLVARSKLYAFGRADSRGVKPYTVFPDGISGVGVSRC